MGKQPITIPKEELERQREFSEQIRRHYLETLGRQPLACVDTYGCQQNEADSQLLRGMMIDMGFGFTEEPDQADLALFNTCAVREHAEQRVFGNIGALTHAKRRRPDMIVAMCGCMAQQERIKEKVKKSFPVVDLLFGSHVLYRFPELLWKRLQSGKRVFDISGDEAGVILEGIQPRRDRGVKAWLPIMYGCNNFCSYCIVPYVRGRERSRRPEAVKAEFRQLVEQGYKDITLLGQNVNSYGKGCDFDCDFADLLEELSREPGDFILRFMTSHPKDASEKLFETMARHDKIAKHLHLPFQSGSSRVLEQMNRSYDREQYLALAQAARRHMPGLTLSSDVIVGFPNETEEDFEQTLSLVEQVRFDNLFTFIYSKREGTAAARMEDQTPMEDKKRRFQRLLDVQNEISNQLNAQCVGKTFRALADGTGQDEEYPLTARTEGQKLIRLKGDPARIGQFVDVTIEKHTTWALFGSLRQG